MLTIATEHDYNYLKEQLLTLIKENECDISNASDSAINTGLQTLMKPFPINQALILRAIEAIRGQVSLEYLQERADNSATENAMQEILHLFDTDSIGPDLLSSNSEDLNSEDIEF